MELCVIIFLRHVDSEPMQIPILIPILMQIGPVPNFTQILVLIRWFFSVIFIVTLHLNHHRNWSQCNLFCKLSE